jgi:hypothetical protein
VRGDSLRDLYAKALAVLGLGMLAGAGALVDFWPTDTQGPRILSAFAPSVLARPLTTPNAFAASSPIPRRSRVARVSSRPPEPLTAYSPSVPVDAPAIAAGSPVALSSPSVAPAESSRDAGAESSAAVQDAVPYDIAANGVRMAPVSEPSADAAGDGFLSSTFKKTGASIRKGGAKTGASIFDAFRAIGGAVRKAFPG